MCAVKEQSNIAIMLNLAYLHQITVCFPIDFNIMLCSAVHCTLNHQSIFTKSGLCHPQLCSFLFLVLKQRKLLFSCAHVLTLCAAFCDCFCTFSLFSNILALFKQFTWGSLMYFWFNRRAVAGSSGTNSHLLPFGWKCHLFCAPSLQMPTWFCPSELNAHWPTLPICL